MAQGGLDRRAEAPSTLPQGWLLPQPVCIVLDQCWSPSLCAPCRLQEGAREPPPHSGKRRPTALCGAGGSSCARTTGTAARAWPWAPQPRTRAHLCHPAPVGHHGEPWPARLRASGGFRVRALHCERGGLPAGGGGLALFFNFIPHSNFLLQMLYYNLFGLSQCVYLLNFILRKL